MGLIYRKRVPVTRSSWLNVSRSGLSASSRLGPLTVNSRGRLSLRLGNGFSWRVGR